MFDYQKAWSDVARPCYLALSDDIVPILNNVMDESKTINHGENFDCVGASAELLESFKSVNSLDLAHASRTIYFMGHWSSERHFQNNGIYWKFANLADQELCKRLGIERRPKNTSGRSISIREGMLTVGLEACGNGCWTEVAYATPENLEFIKNAFSGENDKVLGSEWLDRNQAISREIRKTLSQIPYPFSGFFNLGAYGGND